MKEKLSDLCRERKQTITPHKTNQDVAENTGLSVGTVSQFFRGDIKNPSVYTVGPICREMGVSMDEYFGIPHDEPAELSEPPDAEKLRAETAALRAQLAQQQKSLRMHRLVTLILLGILLLCALSLLFDVLSPSIGWIRA